MMDFAEERARLVKHLGTAIAERRVLDAMARIPRELFVPEKNRHLAYIDEPLSIGHGQTISQPTIVAMMTAALELTGCEYVLEVGTGSGYQAAILSELAQKVITTERIPELAIAAEKTLAGLGYNNVEVHRTGDVLGWLSGAPYDAIIVTAAAPHVPQALLGQLRMGGRLVIPVGTRYLQQLCRIVRQPGKDIVQDLGGCRFVCLIGKDAWAE